MKAFLSERYGSPDVFRLAEIDTPAPGPGHVLVKVLALSVNPADWHCLRGKPLFARATLGFVKPKATILGCDIAGRVEAVGPGVTGAQPGDAVYANLLDTGFGGFAEYVAVPVDVLAPAAPTLSFEEAAALPMAAVTALQGLRYHGEVRPGQAVLVNGASGGVGHFGVQIAKASGAVVTGVTSTSNLDLVRSLGADHVIDYTNEDFTKTGRTYDLVLDTIGNRSVGDLRRALAATGTAAVTGFTSVGLHLARAVRGASRIKAVTAHVTSKDLDQLNTLVAAGNLRPTIDRRYPFAEIPEAVRYLEAGRARGKVVVSLATT